MTHPISTYRIQFHKDFTFDDFEKIIPYLQKLGVGTIYASPVFEAVPGSVHGYDGVNPHRINPEIGTEKQLYDVSKKLKAHGINWLQDIVPNHMAFHPNNEWLMDVLEKGPQSLYASFFDIAWNSNLYHGRIMVPFLGASLYAVISNGELAIAYENRRFVLKYFDSFFPLQPKVYATILQAANDVPLQSIQQLIRQMPKVEDQHSYAELWNEFLIQLDALMKNDLVKAYVEKNIETINNKPGLLLQIAGEQSYQLCHWQETDYQMNYRRFFTVNGLICLNIHANEVFETYHSYIKKLCDDGIFQGLRIDHIDGLYDPAAYLLQLRDMVGDEAYIVVEKILEFEEILPANWPVQGSTGYDFLSMVNNLFTNKNSRRKFSRFYDKLTNNNVALNQQLHDKKSFILYNHMGGELENLYRLFMDTNLVDANDYAQMRTENIKTAIAEFLIHCPVYRYYGNALPLAESESASLRNIFRNIKDKRPDLKPAVNLLKNVLLDKPHRHNEAYNNSALHFYQRCMQFTGPLMAKGVEDTLMYTYNRFIDHNEVGDSPEAFGASVDEFHKQMKERQKQWPLSINATSTHDTKRGEAVRARLNVLTDLPDEWISHIEEWVLMNADLKQNNAPDANDEYFIYQTLIGAYSMPGQQDDNIANRLEEYIPKALREAKTHSNWTTPNTGYEEATKNFASGLLNMKRPFWKSFISFQNKVAAFGIVNSLSQLLLKFTCPGVPDVYQGTELWDLSLVDPDNRRAVDYNKRSEYLDKCTAEDIDETALITELWRNRNTAQINFWLLHKLMSERRNNAALFADGEYLPLQVKGEYKDHILAFARKHNYSWYVVAVPLHLAELCKAQDKEIGEIDWKDSRILPPRDAPDSWQNVLLKEEGTYQTHLAIKDLFRNVPFAFVKLAPVYERSAGILLHITSLPSMFGIGDLGPEAKAFTDFLKRSHQKYWQILPLNPTEEGQAHSPYSSLSSKAGNPLMISPELLVEDGLFNPEALKKYHLGAEDKINFDEAKKGKEELFETAWQTFTAGKFSEMQHEFRKFCSAEAIWLDDFALFMVLKHMHDHKPWFQWPEEYKQRDAKALKEVSKAQPGNIEKIKWLQYIFSRQWKQLREYCNSCDIKLFGDMPFYISYDSADVWSDREIFAIDDEGKMTGVAGVPPDAFSAEGQLWGMPVFKWDVLKKRNYDWWIQRFKKNMELFDIVRLDHFRAFNDYWEVPAIETTAKLGEWRAGPGADLFIVALKKLGSLPFIAEDLGDVNDAVYQLRDEFNLPGMKILQFAFGDDMEWSIHTPHNYKENCIVYTGTHDNNTIRGWLRTEVSDASRHRLEHYISASVSEENIHIALAKLAYNSVAKTVILPMQDVLALNENARMNTPSSSENNWGWRMLPEQINGDVEQMLNGWVKEYKR